MKFKTLAMPPNNNQEPCENCGHDKFVPLYEAADFDTGTKQFTLEECSHCHLVRTAPVLSETQLGRYYHNEYYGSASKKFTGLIERWTQFTYARRAKTILKLAQSNNQIEPPLTVLDIGCGRAHLLKALAEKGCNCVGVERSEFPPKSENGVTIFNQDFLQIDFEQQKFDVIIIWHVLEHLLTPSQTIKKISQLLKPKGILMLAVPNFGSFQAKIFNKYWFHLDLPRHTYHFTHASLKGLLDKNNLAITNSNTWTLDQSIFGFIQSCLNATSTFPPNDLYRLLKHTRISRYNINALVQFLLFFLLSPVAVIEYFLLGLIGKGSCINLQVVPKSDNSP